MYILLLFLLNALSIPANGEFEGDELCHIIFGCGIRVALITTTGIDSVDWEARAVIEKRLSW